VFSIAGPILVLILIADGPVSRAQETKKEFWPEFNGYVPINDVVRLRLVASLTRARETAENTEGTLEADIDIGLKAFLRKVFLGLPDTHRGKYLTFRAGYAYIPTLGENTPDAEHRLLIEATGRYPLPLDILLSDRNRGEFRWISGDFSTRYRNRLKVERDFAIRRFRFTPYAHAEVFYDTRFDIWNRNEIQVGSEFPLGAKPVIEFYFLRQNNSRSQTEHVNGFGLVFQWHF